MTDEFGDDPATGPEFALAMLLPSAMIYVCPVCGSGPDEPIAITEDDSGTFSVPVESRFIECKCGALVDIGWAGWQYHEGAPR